MRIRRTASASLVLVLAAALTACGDDDKSSDPAPKVLTSTEVTNALISLDDLGKDFVVDTEDDDDDDDDADLGCLNDVDKVFESKTGSDSDFEKADAKAEVEYKADSDAEMPFLFSSVYSLKDEKQIAEGFKIFQDAFADCTKVDTTDDDGTRIQLDIKTTQDKTVGADAQVNLVAAGGFSVRIGEGGLRLPFYLRMSLVQVDNNIALVGYGSLVEGGEGDDDSEQLSVVAVNRLLAAIAGKPAPEDPDLDLRLITEEDFFKNGTPTTV